MKKIIFSLIWLLVVANALIAQNAHPELLRMLPKEDSLLKKRVVAKALEMQHIKDLYQEYNLKETAEKEGSAATEKWRNYADSTLSEKYAKMHKNDLEVVGNAIIKNAPIVIEGRLLKGELYLNEDSTEVRHAALIEVSRVLRGEEFVKIGTIEIQTDCGHFLKNRDFIGRILEWDLSLYGSTRDQSIIDYFPDDSTYLQFFFSKKMEEVTPHFKEATNPIILTDYKQLQYNAYCSIKHPNMIERYTYSGLYGLFWQPNTATMSDYMKKYGLNLDKPIIKPEYVKPNKKTKKVE